MKSIQFRRSYRRSDNGSTSFRPLISHWNSSGPCSMLVTGSGEFLKRTINVRKVHLSPPLEIPIVTIGWKYAIKRVSTFKIKSFKAVSPIKGFASPNSACLTNTYKNEVFPNSIYLKAATGYRGSCQFGDDPFLRLGVLGLP